MPLDLPQDIVTAIARAAEGRERIVVAIAGPPGAGKSTVSEALARALDGAAVLPMDGFHLDNDTLRDMGLLHRKGAPQTFDTKGLHALLQRIRQGGDVPVPTFDRAADAVVPDGAVIPAAARIVLVEGNYLLLDAPGWRDLHPFWDLTVAIEVPRAELEKRLIQRWLDHGLSPEDARRRAEGNDLPNADTVRTGSITPDLVFRQD
ncbi:phosphoribulokinase [Marimonas sp. MJW-29]|uniref:Phosphoribulokinase n=1 Tax=Sulfitobacter sediminis TaxID=3234186 RepID=A0ABV3RMD2_9RHOB